MLNSCKTMKTTTQTTSIIHDTINIIHHDTISHTTNNTIYHYTKDKDSTHVNVYQRNDTVFSERETIRERNNYIYINKQDSVYKKSIDSLKHEIEKINNSNSVTVVEKKKSFFELARDKIVDIILFAFVFIGAVYILKHTNKRE